MIKVKFLRLAYRLGQSPHNVVAAYLRGRNGDRVAGFDRANAITEHLEAVGQESLDFSCTTMVLGKTCGGKSTTINSIFDEVKCWFMVVLLGVGKSATINFIFDEVKFDTNAFQLVRFALQMLVKVPLR
ncbi:hypothetical protein NC651_001621 [Populus alba x Populus x berolinensis]|nr:hypothetical protein NC651_001621 [Populus alba x Populus x berolinensis]